MQGRSSASIHQKHVPFVEALASMPNLDQAPRSVVCFSYRGSIDASTLETCGHTTHKRCVVWNAKLGMQLLTDHSGRVFTKQKCSLKDILHNREAGKDVSPRK